MCEFLKCECRPTAPHRKPEKNLGKRNKVGSSLTVKVMRESRRNANCTNNVENEVLRKQI